MHGQGWGRYEHVQIGMNSRLDTVQALIVIEKLKIFEDEIQKHDELARHCDQAFAGSDRIKTPLVIDGVTSTWAQYTLEVSDRATFQAEVKAARAPTMVYYPIPLSRQPAYAQLPRRADPRQRGAQRSCDQPAHVPLYRPSHPGPNHRRGSRSCGMKCLLPRRSAARV